MTTGERLQRSIEAVESRLAAGAAGAVALGAGLGIATIIGGIGVFLLVWVVLVEFLH